MVFDAVVCVATVIAVRLSGKKVSVAVVVRNFVAVMFLVLLLVLDLPRLTVDDVKRARRGRVVLRGNATKGWRTKWKGKKRLRR